MEGESKSKELMFEYGQLRSEILGNFTLGLQILGGTVTFVAAIMTLAFSEALKSLLAKAMLFFVGEAIAFIGLLQTLSLAHSTFQIASYLRIFTEAGLGHVKWETRLHAFRHRVKDLPYEEWTGSVRHAFIFIIIVNCLLGCGYALFSTAPDFEARAFSDLYVLLRLGVDGSPLTVAFVAAVLLATTYLLIVARRQYHTFVLKHDETYESKWEDIKAAELRAQSPQPQEHGPGGV